MGKGRRRHTPTDGRDREDEEAEQHEVHRPRLATGRRPPPRSRRARASPRAAAGPTPTPRPDPSHAPRNGPANSRDQASWTLEEAQAVALRQAEKGDVGHQAERREQQPGARRAAPARLRLPPAARGGVNRTARAEAAARSRAASGRRRGRAGARPGPAAGARGVEGPDRDEQEEALRVERAEEERPGEYRQQEQRERRPPLAELERGQPIEEHERPQEGRQRDRRATGEQPRARGAAAEGAEAADEPG